MAELVLDDDDEVLYCSLVSVPESHYDAVDQRSVTHLAERYDALHPPAPKKENDMSILDDNIAKNREHRHRLARHGNRGYRVSQHADLTERQDSRDELQPWQRTLASGGKGLDPSTLDRLQPTHRTGRISRLDSGDTQPEVRLDSSTTRFDSADHERSTGRPRQREQRYLRTLHGERGEQTALLREIARRLPEPPDAA
jgi:hypothetical protein